MRFLTHKNSGPNHCPSCFASDNSIIKTGKTYTCLECEFSWTSTDEVFAKGMQPDTDSGILGFIRKLGKKDD
jgi:transposase-like protein